MTNLDSQTTADLWDAYLTAAEAANSAQTALCTSGAAPEGVALPQEDRCAECTDSQPRDGDGAPFVQSGDREGEYHGDQPANRDHDDDRPRIEQDRW